MKALCLNNYIGTHLMKLKLSTMALMATIAFEGNSHGIDLDNLEGSQPDNRSVLVTSGQAARGTPALSDQAKPVLKAQSALPSSSSNSPARPVQAKPGVPAKQDTHLHSTGNRVRAPVKVESKGASAANPVLPIPKGRAPNNPGPLSSDSAIAATKPQGVTITCYDKILHLPYSLTAQEILAQAKEFIVKNNAHGNSNVNIDATNVPQHLVATILTLMTQTFKI
jgi:hypothetical protein